MNWSVNNFGFQSVWPTYQTPTFGASYGMAQPQFGVPTWGMSAYGGAYSYAQFYTPRVNPGVWGTVRNASVPADAIAWRSAWMAGAGNLCGNVFDFFGASALMTHARRAWQFIPGASPSPPPSAPSAPKPKPPLPDVLSRASTYYRYRGDPKKYNEVIAAQMTGAHPEARAVKEGDVSDMVEKIEEKQVGGRNLIGREALLKKFAENSQSILSSIDPSIRERLLAGHQSLKIKHYLFAPDGTTRPLDAAHITDDIAADMLLLLLDRSVRPTQQSLGGLREFFSARGLTTDNPDEIGAKGVMLLKDYFGGNWRDVLQMFYQQTVNDAGKITEFPNYNDAATVQHYLLERKHFRPEVAAVIGNYAATYPYERVARVLEQVKDVGSLKDDDSKFLPGEQEFNAYVNAIAMLRGYQKADLETNRERTILKLMPGSGDDKQHRYSSYVPDFRNKPKVAQYLHTLMDRLVEIEQLKAEHYDAHNPSWVDKYNKAFDRKLKEYRRADKNL